MTYEEFEWHILRMVYEEGVSRLSPSFLAYSMGLPHELVNRHLEQAVDVGLIEPAVGTGGSLEYMVPGGEAAAALPTPIWKRSATPEPSRQEPEPEPAPAPREVGVSLSGEEALAAALVGGTDGGVRGGGAATTLPGLNDPSALGHGKKTSSPPSFRTHVHSQRDETDGSLYTVVQARDVAIDRRAVVARGATVDEAMNMGAMVLAGASTALVPAGAGALMRVEALDESFCDPSQTIFIRQIRVHGVKSEQALRQQIGKLFESFGYKSLRSDTERMRFERGSVAFILALVPLFVLVLPLFVYLFLYCMGRSTIQQEPLELDVHIRKSGEEESSYDIDLTFIGLHGIVLGAADQRVLNQEIDTLRDELSWALAAS